MSDDSVLWRRDDIPADEATVHALVIGVSRYDHLPGGSGSPTKHRLLGGLTQLSAAATSAARVATWLRDHFDYPEVRLGSVRLLASPGEGEVPLPAGVEPPPATYDQVKRALNAWRREARATPGNVTLLYVAGHGIQTSNEGGIVLLQDAGDPDFAALDRAIDVASVRRGMVADPTDAETFTPPIQYYFYDACRVQPSAVASFEELRAGITTDEPRGAAPDTSWVLWGSRSRDYALAEAATRTTLFSKALREAFESRAQPDADGRTVRIAFFAMAVETVVDELAQSAGEQQTVISGGAGQLRTPVYLRPLPPAPPPPAPAPAPAPPATVPAPIPPPSTPRPTNAPRSRPRLRLPRFERRHRAARPEPVGAEPDFAPAPAPPPPPPAPPPPPPPPAPRPVTIETTTHEPRGLTIRGHDLVLVGVTGEPLDLPPGAYTAIVDQPWGGSVQAEFTVPAGPDPLTVPLEVPDQPAESTTGAPRLARHLGPGGGAGVRWWLRFLSWTPQGLAHDPDASAPDVEVAYTSGDTSLMVRARTDRPTYAHLRTEDGRSLVVSLPIGAATLSSRCWLHARVSDTTLGAAVRLEDARADACAGYLIGGRPDQTVALAPSAESLLFSKMADPIGAALGGYALVRLGELDRVHNWADNLAHWFDWLPDGPVIAGEVAARRGEDARAAEFFVAACTRGVPLFGEGLSLIGNRVPRLLGDPDVPADLQERLREAAAPLLTLGPMADFGTLASTLRIDPQPGPLTAEHGWREYGTSDPHPDGSTP